MLSSSMIFFMFKSNTVIVTCKGGCKSFCVKCKKYFEQIHGQFLPSFWGFANFYLKNKKIAAVLYANILSVQSYTWNYSRSNSDSELKHNVFEQWEETRTHRETPHRQRGDSYIFVHSYIFKSHIIFVAISLFVLWVKYSCRLSIWPSLFLRRC